MTGCIISHNVADTYGGGVHTDYEYSAASSPCLTRCIVLNNKAGGSGGGLYLQQGGDLIEAEVTGNTAGLEGGGVYCSGTRLQKSVIRNNQAAWDGGGGYVSGSSLSDCLVVGHEASQRGGGVYCAGTSSLSGCVIAWNRAPYGGGAACASGSPGLTACLLAGNRATLDGGGFYISGASPAMRQCLLTRNVARAGSGLFCTSNSSPDLVNCILSHNRADTNGGAVYSTGGGSFINTLVAWNHSGLYYSSGSPTVFRYNCVWGNGAYNYGGSFADPTGMNNNISENPLLVGGHLLPGSPCINRGDNDVVVGNVRDFDWEPRIASGQVDIGADEYHSPIVQGWLVFSDYAGEIPVLQPFELRIDASEERLLPLDLGGGFVLANVVPDVFDFSLKPSHWLRRTVTVDLWWGSLMGLTIPLVNGDIDGDNEVTLFDFGAVVTAFGSQPGDTNWNPDADLDGDDEVTLLDFGILVKNFGEVGDE